MSASSLSGLFQILDVKRSELVGKAKDIVVAYFDEPDRDPADDVPVTNDETEPAEWWTPYGLYGRPPDGSTSFVVRAGATFAALASRVVGIGDVVGKLAAGDVALWSVGRNVLRLNASGSVSLLVRTENGKQVVVNVSPKGSGEIKVVTGAGMSFELSEANGLAVNVGQKDVTFACRNFQVVGQSANLNVASTRLHMAASTPFAGGGTMPPAPGVFL